jgi:ketosteroid isomerase-like protein
MTSLEELQQGNVEAIQGGVEAFRRGDFDAVLELLDPEIEVYMPSELANSGTYRGHDGYRRWLAQWLEAWDDFDLELDDIEAVGRTHVVSRAHQTARGRGSGIPVEMWISYLWDVRDGHAVALHLYPSRDEAIEVAERREREASE